MFDSEVDPLEVARVRAEEKGRNRGRVRQQAIRRMCLGKDKKLNGDARILLTYLNKFCNGDGITNSAVRVPSTGAVDPLAMAQAVGRREVFDLLMRILHVTLEERHNLKDVT
jgi:hypothetical protein